MLVKGALLRRGQANYTQGDDNIWKGLGLNPSTLSRLCKQPHSHKTIATLATSKKDSAFSIKVYNFLKQINNQI